MKLKRFEIALALGLLFCILTAAMTTGTQAGLSGKLVRLHILANSDSEADQAIKLAVRDRLLTEADFSDGDITAERLARLEAIAQDELARLGSAYSATVSRAWMYFDTREYEGFALPAGYYDAVRVVIGAGEGRNWWCVMYPGLCNGASETELADAAYAAGFTDDELSFIRQDGTTYVVRFKLAEIAGRIRGFWAE